MNYYAFISYSHKDMKKVRKLHKGIEGFRIPFFLRKKFANAPKKIYPIFRDETDLVGLELEKRLKDALVSSECLIVICSSASADSEWVNLEISEFSKLCGRQKIIPVVLSPVKKSDIKDILPEGLFDKNNPLPIDFVDSSNKTGLFEIITKILGCFSQEMVHRYKVIHNTIRAVTAFFLIFVAMSVFVEIGWWYNNNIDNVRYFENISYTYEFPEGVNRISKCKLSGKDEYYVCTFKDNRIQTVEHIRNTPETEMFPETVLLDPDMTEIYYNNNYVSARVSKIVYKDSDGKIMFIKNLFLSMDHAELSHISPDSALCQVLSEFGIKYDSNNPKIHIVQFYDSYSRVKNIIFIGADDKGGFENGPALGMIEYTYDGNHVSSVSCFDAYGKLIHQKNADATEK